MIKRIIEFVCVGNNGRSPIAELIAKNHLAEIGADYLYKAISSGTHVGGSAEDDPTKHSLKFKLECINGAKERGFYSTQEMVDIDLAIGVNSEQAINAYFLPVIKAYLEEEQAHKVSALQHFGIEGRVKTTRDRTVRRTSVAAIVAMDKKTYEHTQELYVPSERKPLIACLEPEVTKIFGRGQKAYNAAVEMLLHQVPLRVNEALQHDKANR